MIMLPAFFALVNPVSTIAKPHCIKNTNTAPKRYQILISILFTPFYYDISVDLFHRMSAARPGISRTDRLLFRKVCALFSSQLKNEKGA